jgi:flavin-binding protein dodecin
LGSGSEDAARTFPWLQTEELALHSWLASADAPDTAAGRPTNPETLRQEPATLIFHGKMPGNGSSVKEAAKMAGIYKVVELIGTSPTSFAEATKAAIVEASKTIRHMNWFEVVRESGRIMDGKVEEFQVMLRVGFKIER